MRKKITITALILIAVFALLSCAAPESVYAPDQTQIGAAYEQQPIPAEEKTSDGPIEETIAEEVTAQEPAIPAPEPEPEIINVSQVYEVKTLVDLNVRDKASASGSVAATVKSGSVLPYISSENGWYKVYYNNKALYVSANSSYSYLKRIGEPGIEDVISVGMSLMATPYEYGATRIIDYNYKRIASFTGNTFDCSSFVQYSFYIGAGRPLMGDSRSMSTQGVSVSSANIKRGDVLFMTSTARQYNTGIERIGHVAIYLGDNKILHTFGTGGVRVQEYSEFWKGRFISAKRMI